MTDEVSPARLPEQTSPQFLADYASAQRIADNVAAALAMVGGSAEVAARMAVGHRDFIALRLLDGHWDGVLYDSRSDALRHQSGDRNLYAYIPVPPERWTVRLCQTLLGYWRAVYDGGYRPDGAHEGITIARTPNSIEVLHR